jgi:energy-coupling factor transport system substrate-specific component
MTVGGREGWVSAFAKTAFLCLIAAAANVATNSLSERLLHLPFFMDSVFTVAASVGLGAWPGLAVAILTNAGQEAMNGFAGTNLPFALCGMATALIARILAPRREGPALFLSMALVIVLVTLANAAIGGAVAALLFHGRTDVAFDTFVDALVAVGQSYAAAAFWARIPVNLLDKSVAVLVGLAMGLPLRSLSRPGGRAGRGPAQAPAPSP